jgi:hypothetical protein
MSIFLSIVQKYTPTSAIISPTLSNPVSPNVIRPVFIQNGGPESSRMARNKCTNCTLSKPAPVLVETKPASKTTEQKATSITDISQINIQNVTNTEAQKYLFGSFFPPPVPPPQFLQVPPTRSNNEPRARASPCVGPHRWELSP